MIRLSKKAEDLLTEIIKQRNEKGICNTEYWRERFNNLSVQDDVILRGLFKELREANAISVSWADDYPYVLYVLANGISYFEEKQKFGAINSSGTCTNNFYGTVSNVQIQQNSTNSYQMQQGASQFFDGTKLNELVQLVKRYDPILDDEFGIESADNLRKCTQEIEQSVKEPKASNKIKNALLFIRDLSVNAGGGLVASGLIQLIETIVR